MARAIETGEAALARYREARMRLERTRAQRIFLGHLAFFVAGTAFFGFWNMLTFFVKEDDTLWFYMPLLFWGVGVIIHYLQGVALFDNWWDLDEKLIKERLEEEKFDVILGEDDGLENA